MKKKILIVEDDDFFRSAVKSILSKTYEVLEANDGKVAKTLLMMSSFDLIISDIQMPHFNGVDLLTWVKSEKKNIPIILMTGFAQILETRKAHELGADDFLAKPFKEEELLEKVRKIFKEDLVTDLPENSTPANLDEQFCNVPIEDFLTEKQADYPIFIRVSASKYIKIAHQGGKLPESKVASFKEKGVTHLFVRREDFAKLVNFTTVLSKVVSTSEQVNKAKKSRFMKYTGELIMQQAFVQGTDEAIFKNAKDFLNISIDVLTEDQETFELLNLLSTHTDYLYTHSLAVSMFSVIIARNLGWQSPQTLFKISFAGLFHDIGKKEIPRELLEKPRSLLSQQERTLLETHTTRGKEILESLRTAPSEVIHAAYEHHEDNLGQGYPQRLPRSRIHPVSLVVNVADIFCNYTIKNPQNHYPIGAAEAIVMMKKFKEPAMDDQTFEALIKAVDMKKIAI